MGLPALVFEYADGAISEPSTAGTWTWTDCTGVVRLSDGPAWSRGRQDEKSAVGPGTMTWTVDNTTGSWSVDGSGVARIGLPVRVRLLAANGNLVTNSTLETNATGWGGLGTPTPTVARSTTRAWQGSASLLVTWGTSAPTAQNVTYALTGLTVGHTYTASAYVWVPAGKSKAYLGAYFLAQGDPSTTYDAWERLTVTFTATAASHTLVVGHLEAVTAGDTLYVDGVMVEHGSTASAFTATAPTLTTLWTGFVGSMSAGWVGGVHPVTRLQCVDLMTWVARQTASVPGAARLGVSTAAPEAWWPMDDRAGSAKATPAAGTVSLDGTPTGNEADGTARFMVDGVPALTLAPSGFSRGWSFHADTSVTLSGYDRTFMCHVRVDGGLPDPEGVSPATSRSHIAGWCDSSGAWLDLSCSWAGRLWVTTYVNSAHYQWPAFPAINDGKWHHVAIVLQRIGTGSTSSMQVWLDGAQASTWGFDPTAVAAANFGDLAGVSVSAAATYTLGAHSLLTGAVAHVACFARALSEDEIRACAGPGIASGSTAAEAVEALLGQWGVGVTAQGTFGSALDRLPLSGSLLPAVQSAAEAERGIVHAHPGLGMVVQARSVRGDHTPALTLAPTDVSSDLSPQADDADVVNEAVISSQSGASSRRVSLTSQDTYGVRDHRVTLPLRDEASCAEHAAWLVMIRDEPTVRIGSATVQATAKAATVDTATLVGLDLSDVVRITDLPGSPATLDLFVEGVAMRAGLDGLTVTLNLSPVYDPDALGLDAMGDLVAWWDARWPNGQAESVPLDGNRLLTWTDLADGTYTATAAGVPNLFADKGTFESGVALGGTWTSVGAGTVNVASTTRAWQGSRSLRYSAGSTRLAMDRVRYQWASGFTIGATYTVSAYVYNSAGGTPVRMGSGYSGQWGTSSTTTGAWERIEWTHTAMEGQCGGFVQIEVGFDSAPKSGQTVDIDGVMIAEGSSAGTWTTDGAEMMRPRYDFGSPDGAPTIEFDELAQEVVLDTPLTVSGAARTVYMAVRPAALASRVVLGSTAGARLGWLKYISDTDIRWGIRDDAGHEIVASAGWVPDGGVVIHTAILDGSGGATLRHNGSDVATGTGLSGTLTAEWIGGTALSPFDGGVGAILVYDDAHDAATVAQVERALSILWGVSLA